MLTRSRSARRFGSEEGFSLLQQGGALLVVSRGSGKVARDRDSFRAIVATLRRLESDETLLVQSGKPVGVFLTSVEAPRVLLANPSFVGRWAS